MEYLFDLEKAVEAVETRVPFGKRAMALILSMGVIYVLFLLAKGLALDLFWPMTQLAVAGLSGIRGGTIKIPASAINLTTLSWLLAAAVLGAAIVAVQRTLGKLYNRLKEVEVAIDKYRSIFWQPLTTDQKQRLRDALIGMGARPIFIEHSPNTDCGTFANQLAGTFKDAGWYLLRFPYPSNGSYAGLYIRAKTGLDFVDRLILIMGDIGISATADFNLAAEHDADFILFVGPKIAPLLDPLLRSQAAAGKGCVISKRL